MEKIEWLQALLDGKTMTSDTANGRPICFNSNGKFEYIDSIGEYKPVNVNHHETTLREYFEYPMWFESISGHLDKGLVIRFDSIDKGMVVKEASNGYYEIGKELCKLTDHTDTSIWKQVPKPHIVEEITLEEVCKLLGKNIKIVKG